MSRSNTTTTCLSTNIITLPAPLGWVPSVIRNTRIFNGIRRVVAILLYNCERDRLEYGNRALVWMLNLTDTPNGGTEFPHQELISECVKGDLIIWPSDLTHLHRGAVSETHEKMIFTGWIIFIPQENLDPKKQ